MIRKLLLLLLTVGMLAKHSGGGGDHSSGGRPGETPEERMQREMDEMWGDHGGRGSSTTLEEAFANVDNELDQSDNSVNSTPATTNRQGAWDTDDEGVNADRDAMNNWGLLTEERKQKILYGDLKYPKDAGGHHWDSDVPGKTVFPKSWDEDRIFDAGREAMNNPDRIVPRPGSKSGYECYKQIDGVDVVVVLNKDGTIWGIHPTGGDGTRKNPPA